MAYYRNNRLKKKKANMLCVYYMYYVTRYCVFSGNWRGLIALWDSRHLQLLFKEQIPGISTRFPRIRAVRYRSVDVATYFYLFVLITWPRCGCCSLCAMQGKKKRSEVVLHVRALSCGHGAECKTIIQVTGSMRFLVFLWIMVNMGQKIQINSMLAVFSKYIGSCFRRPLKQKQKNKPRESDIISLFYFSFLCQYCKFFLVFFLLLMTYRFEQCLELQYVQKQTKVCYKKTNKQKKKRKKK